MAEGRLAKLEEMQKANPDDPFFEYAIALEYMSANDLQASLRHFERLNKIDAKYLPQYYQFGKLYEMLNEPEKAAAAYEQGMEVAQAQGEQKTLNELRQALEFLEE